MLASIVNGVLTDSETYKEINHEDRQDQIQCVACKELAIFKSEFSIHQITHFAHKRKNGLASSDCPLRNGSPLYGLRADKQDLDARERGLKLRSAFFEETVLTKAFFFMQYHCGSSSTLESKPVLSVPDFKRVLQVLCGSTIWEAKGMETWIIAMLGSSLITFTRPNSSGDTFNYKYAIKKIRKGFLIDAIRVNLELKRIGHNSSTAAIAPVGIQRRLELDRQSYILRWSKPNKTDPAYDEIKALSSAIKKLPNTTYGLPKDNPIFS